MPNPLDTADFNIDGIAAMANFSVVRSLCQPPHQHTWDEQAVKMFWPSWVIVPDKIISNFASQLQSLRMMLMTRIGGDNKSRICNHIYDDIGDED